MQAGINAAATLFERGAAQHIAIVCGERQISYGELAGRVARAAHAWQKAGLAPDDRVLVLAPDGIEWVEAYLGAIWAGGVPIGANPRAPLPELAPVLAESGARYAWVAPQLAPSVQAIAGAMPHGPTVVTAAAVPGTVDWYGLLAAARRIAPVPRRARDAALWISTSGTTGRPKAVIHMQTVTAPCDAFARELLGASADDRFYATSKLTFAYALANSFFAGLRLGATVILDEEWPNAERVAAMAERHRPTLLFSVPTLYRGMLQAGVAERLARCGVRHYVSAGEALPPVLCDGWRERTGKVPWSGYGTSETLCLMLYSEDGGRLRPTPLTRMRFPEGSTGLPQRILVEHPAIAAGYWERPDDQRDAFVDEAFRPGDLFLRHDDGLEFVGRNDDLLKIAGQWVSTQWVEQHLQAACGDALQTLAAVGVTTSEGLGGIAVFAIAVPELEEQARGRLQAAIAGLPGHKRPRWVHWVESLPQTATGKLQRSRLAELHRRAVEAAGSTQRRAHADSVG